jgi:DNA-binding transcriptional LysR family regulator
MELRHLRYFVMSAEEQNISRASARLNISQPAVSRQLKDLEEELGVKLFNRERNGLQLTQAGETALVHAREILRRSNGLTEAMKGFAGPTMETIRVGFIPTALTGFLADALRQFNANHPNVSVEIRELMPKPQEDALRRGELDLALLGSVCPELRKEFRTQAILKTPVAAVLPDHHRLASRKAIDLAELSEERFVSLDERFFPGRPEMMAELGRRAGFKPVIRFFAEGFSELLGLVAGGAGVAVMPADVAQLPHPRVVFVALRRPKINLISSAAWSKQRESMALLDLLSLLSRPINKNQD